MAPVSTTVHTQNIFNALERLEDFQYSSIQLHTFYKNTTPIKSSVKTRSSAYQVFRTENKGNKDIPKWSDIKNDPIQLSKYQNTAISLNLTRGFTDEDPKIINKHKSQQRKLTIQAAIDFEKQKKNTSHTFDDIDINKDGVITREEFDNFNLNKHISIEQVVDETEQVVEETEQVVEETETVIEETEQVIEETEPEVEENLDESEDPLIRLNLHQDEKPLYTGKNNSSALSNFKQWILNENELPFNSKIPNSDMKEYKDKYDFDKNKYLLVDECPWFEFIQNNMSIQ